MKILRKIVVFLICVVLFATTIICVGMVFAVKNVNITLITFEDEYEQKLGEVKSSVGFLKGETIWFVEEESVYDTVTEMGYNIVSFEKHFPCTVDIVLKDRIETFAVSVGGLYYMYDDDGGYLKGRVGTENLNPDGSPNVELKGVAPEQMSYIAGIANDFKSHFSVLRSAVKSIVIDTRSEVEGYTDKLVFEFYCGLKVRLDDFNEYTSEKIAAAYEVYSKLGDGKKLGGTIRSYRLGGEEGVINADYSAL